MQNAASSPFLAGLPFIDNAVVAAVYVRVVSIAWNQNDGVIIAFCSDRIADYLSTFIDEHSFDHLQRRGVDDQSVQIEQHTVLPKKPVRVRAAARNLI